MKETFEQILAANINYIKTIAGSLGFDNDEDLIQVGSIELYRTWLNYNPELSPNVPFMMYAGYNIRNQMKSYLSNNLRTIKIPSGQLRIEFKKNLKDREFNYAMVSTQKRINKESETTLGDTLVDDVVEGIDEDQKEALYDAIKQLKPKHRKLIEMRYGINQPLEKEHTLVEIGALYGDSKENIRQTMLRAEKQLKEILLQAA